MQPNPAYFFQQTPVLLFARFCSILLSLIAVTCSGQENEEEPAKLTLGDLLAEVSNQYPPYLSALIERDVAEGRLRSATGAFDYNVVMKVFNNSTGFYQSTTTEAGFEKFTGIWGSTVFGGYRYTDGFLPDYYYKRRTDAAGTPSIGVKIPLLQDGSIDKRRTALYRVKLDRERVEPWLQRQLIDFGAAAMKAYVGWAVTGQKLLAAESMLELAKKRETAIQTQIENGLVAPVVALENRQLVISRELALTQLKREFEVAAIALSLFHRDDADRPIVPDRSMLPILEPISDTVTTGLLENAIQLAGTRWPELRQFELEFKRLDIDLELNRNQLLPRLDTVVSAQRSLGNSRYKDTGELELILGLEFSVPLERNLAKGKIEQNRAKIEQLAQKFRFAENRIVTEVQSAHAALSAALEQLQKTRLNVELATQLVEVEQDRFDLGATDLLALQIREQNAYKAQLDEIKASKDYFTSLGDFLAASAIDWQNIDDHPFAALLVTILGDQ